MNNLKPVDHSELGTNQAIIILLLILAFILNIPILVGIVGVFMLAGTILKRPGFGWVYRGLLAPAGMVKAHVLEDNPEPHRFAQGFGSLVLLGSLAALLSGLSGLGWGLAWLVVGLAALNLFAGFCVGCAIYYWLGRFHLPGFVKAPPPGTFPGLRPRRRQV